MQTKARNDRRVLKEFTRVIEGEAGVALECLTISWPHPSKPESLWVLAQRLPPGTAPETIESERRALLQLPDFFRICTSCGERNPLGWMCDDEICQGCAEGKFGVVF